MAKVALVVLVVGVIGIVLGGVVLLVSVMLPSLTSGRRSWEEAIIGIIPGALLMVVSFVVAIVGLVVMLFEEKEEGRVAYLSSRTFA